MHRKSLEGEPRSGRLSEAVNGENCCAMETVVLRNRGVNVYLIADTVGLSTGSLKMILREYLLTTKFVRNGLPKCLTKNEGFSTRNIK